MTPDTPLWCTACKAEHPASEFYKNKSQYSGHATECRKADKIRLSTPEAMEANRKRCRERIGDPEFLAEQKVRRQVRAERNGISDGERTLLRLRAVVDAWKASGCVDCGYTDVRALEADHVDPATKAGPVATLIKQGRSEATIRDELAKCEVRCVRCHRRRTGVQRPGLYLQRENNPPKLKRKAADFARNDALKPARGCVDCGWREWARGLDWDHVGLKTGGVADLISRFRPWSEIEAEIALCEVRCANCHRIATIERLGSDRRRSAPESSPDE